MMMMLKLSKGNKHMNEDFLMNLINTLRRINDSINQPSWFDYGFLIIGIINLVVLILTLRYLIKYTIETQGMKKEMVKQTKIEQMPVMALYIRYSRDSMKNPAKYEDQQEVLKKIEPYLLKTRLNGDSDYYLTLRNVGKGMAFNVKIESNKFQTIKYKTNFFAPIKDEHPIAINKFDKKIENLDELKDSIFEISCANVNGEKYKFKYKIIDIDNKEVEYLGIEKDTEIIEGK